MRPEVSFSSDIVELYQNVADACYLSLNLLKLLVENYFHTHSIKVHNNRL